MRTLIALIVVAVFVVGQAAYAQPQRMARKAQDGTGPHGPMGITEQLNLSDSQQKEFDKIRFDHQKQMVAHRARVETAELELKQIFKAEAVDKGALEKKTDEIASLRTQAAKMRINHWFAVNKGLTPEQQKVWKNVLERGGRGMHEGMPMRQGRGGMRGSRR